MSTSLRVAVLGATGALGGAVLDRLAGRAGHWRVTAFGGPNRSPRVDSVPFGAESLPVEPVGGIAEAEADVVVCAAPPAIAARLVPGLAGRGRVVVDLGNATAGAVDAPLWVPALNGDLPADFAASRVVRVPGGAGWLLGAVASALVDEGLARLTATVLLPATRRGRGGGDEFGEQVVASFQQRDPPRRHFPDGLAFDVDPEDTPDDEWSEAERLAAAEVHELCGLPVDRVAVTLATVPLHSGMVASLHLAGVGLDAAEAALRAAGALKLVSRAARVRPRVALGREQVLCGRPRRDPGGDGVHLWCAADNLAGPAATAVDVLDRLAHAGGIGRSEG